MRIRYESCSKFFKSFKTQNTLASFGLRRQSSTCACSPPPVAPLHQPDESKVYVQTNPSNLSVPPVLAPASHMNSHPSRQIISLALYESLYAGLASRARGGMPASFSQETGIHIPPRFRDAFRAADRSRVQWPGTL